eukprot:TRINITY_DN6124_c0_g1_i1.p2 TRINITY_DN6124_c0_g1~~TRINITY_DN6124_c0_g1_i1.p2  ORF type:complete len:112 (+),score=23.66 TRINITY_DN6124_c0_g1_i1:326-661(+)
MGLRQGGATFRLRVNAFLNSCGRYGGRTASAFAVCAMAFTLTEAMINYGRDTEELLNAGAAGVVTGAAFKATKGIKGVAIGGAVGGAVVAGLAAVREPLSDVAPSLVPFFA